VDVVLVVAAGLMRLVSLAAGVFFHRPLEGLGGCAAEQLPAFPEQRVPVQRLVHLLTTPWLEQNVILA
jgi:hypothetical protein